MTLIRSLVSGSRTRIQRDGYDLDLSFITPRIIAMGYPAAAGTAEVLYRNSASAVANFLNTNYANSYMIFNLTERSYDARVFNGAVADLGWRDHHPPGLKLLMSICQAIDVWLQASPSHVAVVHCKAGRGRTGTVVASYLLFAGAITHPAEAIAYFGNKRSTDGRQTVTVPSQRRALRAAAGLCTGTLRPHQCPVLLRELAVMGFPERSSLVTVVIKRAIGAGCDTEVLFDSALAATDGARSKVALGPDARVVFNFDEPLELVGDIELCFSIDPYPMNRVRPFQGGGLDSPSIQRIYDSPGATTTGVMPCLTGLPDFLPPAREPTARLSFHTGLVRPGTMVFRRHELDGPVGKSKWAPETSVVLCCGLGEAVKPEDPRFDYADLNGIVAGSVRRVHPHMAFGDTTDAPFHAAAPAATAAPVIVTKSSWKVHTLSSCTRDDWAAAGEVLHDRERAPVESVAGVTALPLPLPPTPTPAAASAAVGTGAASKTGSGSSGGMSGPALLALDATAGLCAVVRGAGLAVLKLSDGEQVGEGTARPVKVPSYANTALELAEVPLACSDSDSDDMVSVSGAGHTSCLRVLAPTCAAPTATATAVLPSGNVLTGHIDGSLRLWTPTSDELNERLVLNVASVFGVAGSPIVTFILPTSSIFKSYGNTYEILCHPSHVALGLSTGVVVFAIVTPSTSDPAIAKVQPTAQPVALPFAIPVRGLAATGGVRPLLVAHGASLPVAVIDLTPLSRPPPPPPPPTLAAMAPQIPAPVCTVILALGKDALLGNTTNKSEVSIFSVQTASIGAEREFRQRQQDADAPPLPKGLQVRVYIAGMLTMNDLVSPYHFLLTLVFPASKTSSLPLVMNVENLIGHAQTPTYGILVPSTLIRSGLMLITHARDGTIRTWDAGNGRQLTRGSLDAPDGVAVVVQAQDSLPDVVIVVRNTVERVRLAGED